MTITEASSFFSRDELITSKLNLLANVGLGYLTLGQSLDTLSGGEAQRVKLSSHLSKHGDTYVLDEPTRGLHPADVANLLTVLEKLVEKGNTVIVVEHDLNVIRNADWIIDMGPEGGRNGGRVIAEGPPEVVMQTPGSHTGLYLAKLLHAPSLPLRD